MDLCGIMQTIVDKSLPLYSNLANASAVLGYMENINWCGFYLAEGGTLYVGPFQGEPACAVIPFGKGVCGTAAAEKRTVIVPDVTKFPGHIACSEKSRSEIVVPILRDGCVLGVIDIDAPILDRFHDADAEVLSAVATLLADLF